MLNLLVSQCPRDITLQQLVFPFPLHWHKLASTPGSRDQVAIQTRSVAELFVELDVAATIPDEGGSPSI